MTCNDGASTATAAAELFLHFLSLSQQEKTETLNQRKLKTDFETRTAIVVSAQCVGGVVVNISYLRESTSIMVYICVCQSMPKVEIWSFFVVWKVH